MMFNLDTVTKQVAHDVNALIEYAVESRYAMARALTILREVTERKYWRDGTHPSGAVIMLLTNCLQTKDVRTILVEGSHTIVQKHHVRFSEFFHKSEERGE